MMIKWYKNQLTLTRVQDAVFRHANRRDSVFYPADHCRWFHLDCWIHGNVLRYTINVFHWNERVAVQIYGPNRYHVKIYLIRMKCMKNSWNIQKLLRAIRTILNIICKHSKNLDRKAHIMCHAFLLAYPRSHLPAKFGPLTVDASHFIINNTKSLMNKWYCIVWFRCLICPKLKWFALQFFLCATWR